MYLKSKFEHNLFSSELLDGFNGTGLIWQGSSLATDYLSSTAMPVSILTTDESNFEIKSSQSSNQVQDALSTFDGHLSTLESGIAIATTGVISARETAEDIKTALGIFGDIEDGADTIADIMVGFRNVLKIVGQVGPLKSVSKKLDGVFKTLIDKVREIEAKAKEIDDKLEPEQQAVQDAIDTLVGFEITLDDAAALVASVRSSVGTANSVYDEIEGFSYTDPDTGVVTDFMTVLAGINSTFSPSNDNFTGVNGFLTEADNLIDNVAEVFSAADPFLAQARAYGAQIASILAELDFLEKPMADLNSVLSPIADILSAVGIIYDTFVAPIVDPILDAFGINDLFDSVADLLSAPFDDLPDLTDIGDAIGDVIDNLVPDVGTSFLDDITDPLNNFLADLGSEFIDLVLQITPDADEVFLLEDGQINQDGGTGDDLISGNDLDNIINGMDGDDVLTPGRGNDIVDGGAGIDGVILNATLGQLSFSRVNATEVVFNHIRPTTPSNDQGIDTIRNVEHFIFSDGLSLTSQQLDEVVFLGNEASFDGTEEIDFVIGDTSASNFNNVIRGFGGNDYLNGGTGADVIEGGDGDDTLAGGGNDNVNLDYIDGGDGTDTATFADLAAGVSVILLDQATRDANPGLVLLVGPAGEEAIIVNVERVVTTDFGDNLYGDFGANTLLGGAGNDIVRGLLGDDILDGGDGQDFLFGDIGNDTLIGGLGDDFLTSGHGDDTLIGGGGFDTLFYGGSITPTALTTVLNNTGYRNVASQGIAGDTDRIIYDGETQTIREFDSNGDLVGTDTISGIERIYGGDGDNIFEGSSDVTESLIGGSGNDIIRGNGSLTGEEEFFAGGGDDIIYLSGIGAERGNGGAGVNTIIYENSGELTRDYSLSINATSGDNTIDFSASAYALTTGASAGTFSFADTFNITTSIEVAGIDSFYATDFDDVLDFRGRLVGAVYGGEGNDTIYGDFGEVGNLSEFHGGAGDDILYTGDSGRLFYGDEGNDIFIASATDTLSGVYRYFGGDGDDLLIAGRGDDIFIGGAGSDTVSFLLSPTGVDISLSGTLSNDGWSGFNDFRNGVENVIGTNASDTIFSSGGGEIITLDGNDFITGGSIIYAGHGNDTIDSGFGDDIISAGTGNNTVDGGDGVDTVLLGFHFTTVRDPNYLDVASNDIHNDTTVIADLMTGIATMENFTSFGADFTTTLQNVENLTSSSLDDDLRGDQNANILIAAGGDDLLMGRNGDDSLAGGNGNDVLIGGAGDDILLPGRGQDRLYGGLGNDYVALISGNIDTVIDLTLGELTRTYDIDVPAWADTGSYEARAIQLSGGGFVVMTPTDVFEADFAHANSATDLARLYDSSFMDDLAQAMADGYAEIAFNTVTESSYITLSSIENVTGGDGNDDITGTSGDNLLDGYGGNDIIRGGGGNDTLTGGDGDDHLIGDGGGGALDAFGFVNLNFGGQDVLPNNQGTSGSISDFLEVQNLTSIGTETFTIEMLYQASEAYGDDGALLSYAVAGTGDEILFYTNGGAIDVYVNAVRYQTGLSADLLHDGAMHRLSFSYELFPNNTGEVRVYIDGALEYSGARANTAITAGGRLIIGQDQDFYDSNAEFNRFQLLSGRVSDIRIFDDVRTATEIADNTINLLDPATAGLVENWVVSDAIDNTVGTAVMTLTGGSLTLVGEAGDDILEGGAGADIHDGREGYDIASYASFGSDGAFYLEGITLNLQTPSENTLDAQGDTFISIEEIVGSRWEDTFIGDGSANNFSGGAGSDTLSGLAGDDVLNGNEGDDLLIGGTGDDQLFGGERNDTLRGGAGADVLDGGEDSVSGGRFGDIADYSDSTAAVSVNLSTGAASGGFANGDTLIDIEAIIGSNFDDTLIGDATSNFFEGLGGADFFDGGDDYDIVSYVNSNAGVVINLTTNQASGGHAAGDSFSGIESVVGSAYDDVLTGTDASSGYSGGAGDDIIFGLGGTDTIFGGDGDDIMIGGLGDDLILGGYGNDTISYVDSAEAVIVDFIGGVNGEWGTGLGGTAEGDYILDIENITGSDFGDTLSGDIQNNLLDGGAGDDLLNGREGDDILIGGTGADSLDGGDGFDTANYAHSHSRVTVRLYNGSGVGGDAQGDTYVNIEAVQGSTFNDTLIGSSTQGDTLSGGDGIDGLFGLSGDDILVGGAGADILDGGFGIDTADYTGSNAGVAIRLFNGTASGGDAQGDNLTSIESVIGSLFDDTLIGASTQSDTLNGAQGNDGLYGLAGDDFLMGGVGDDSLIGGIGADALDGGVGHDTADYSDSASAVTIRLYDGTGLGGDAQGDTLSNIEIVEGSDFSDTLIGSSIQSDILIGGAGNDYLGGLAGDDILIGGIGADTLDGGASLGDMADYSESAAGVTVRLFNGTGTGGDAQGDVLSNIEGVIGSDFADVLIGSSLGVDTLLGGADDDALFGLAGNDILIGGAGADTLDGGASLFDVTDYSGSDAAVIVRLFNGTGSGGDAQGDSLTNIEVVEGSAFNDTLIGSSLQIDTLIGGDGDDALFGLAGNDTLIGGAGADTLDGGVSNADTADYSDSDAGIVVRLFNGTGLGGHAQGDTLSNIEGVIGSLFDDTLVGTFGQTDILRGGEGTDSLFGLSGNDIIDGGFGNDSISGGSGNDLFVFDDGFGQDIITDFSDGFDRLDMSGVAVVNSIADFALSQSGTDVLISLDANNSVTLENTQLADIDDADFIFAGAAQTPSTSKNIVSEPLVDDFVAIDIPQEQIAEFLIRNTVREPLIDTNEQGFDEILTSDDMRYDWDGFAIV